MLMGKTYRNVENIDRWKAMHGLRSSNAAQPHKSRKVYDRKADKRRAMKEDY